MECRVTLAMEFPHVTIAVEAWRFELQEQATGSVAGCAVVCPEARYASVRWVGAARLERLHLSGQQWRDVDAEGPTAAGLLERLRGERRSAVVVGPVEVVPIAATPGDMVMALDAAAEGVLRD